MTTFGVTDTGFVLKRLVDIRTDLIAALSSIIDPVTGETLTINLTDENDPLVQHINATSDSLAEAWEQLQLAVNQYDPLNSSGIGLSGLVQLNGIRRLAGTYSTVPLTLSGTAGTILPVGQLIGPLDDSSVWTLPAVTFDGYGAATCVATCTVKGPVAALSSTLVKILTPYPGWDSVTNTTATPGTDQESDTDLRARQQVSTMTTAASMVEAIYGAIMNLSDVTYCRVYQNLTAATDGRGIPSKTIAVIVQGGTDADIADVLWHKASAFPQYGTTEILVYDILGIAYTMRFIRPASTPIFVSVTVDVIDALIWPTNGADLIKAAIISFAAGALSGVSGLIPNGYSVGQAVYASELYIPVNTLGGINITSILVGITTPGALGFVVLDWDHIAEFISVNITVTVT